MGQKGLGVRSVRVMKITTLLVSSFAVVLFAAGCGGAPANLPEAPAVPSGVPAAPAVPEMPAASGVPAAPTPPAVPTPPAAPAVPGKK